MSPHTRPLLDPRRRVDEEIRHHIEEKTDLLVAEGWDPVEARREAERSFGDVARIRREMLAARRGRAPGIGDAMRSAGSDLHYALRGVRARPGFTTAVVVTLALGIGAASSIFAVADALLLRPMPYADPERWVAVAGARSDGGFSDGMVGGERIRTWRTTAAEAGLTEGWVAWVPDNLVRTDGARAEALDVVAVTPGAEALLGIPLLMGRGFAPEDARPGAPAVALLAEEYWERTGADPDVLGRTLRLESGPVTVVGILGGGVKFPQWGDRPDLWIPLGDDLGYADREPAGGVPGLWAKLAPGLDPSTAGERFDVLAGRLDERLPMERGWAVQLVPVGSYRAGADMERAVWTLGATVVALFLVTLVNGVNLLLVRATGRAREISVRRALGASPRRLLRQLLVEGLVLGLMGGAGAVTLAWGAVAGVARILPSEVLFFSPHAFEVEARTLLFAFVVSFLVGTVLGLIPALRSLGLRRPSLASGSGRDDSPTGRRVRNGLVVSQVALSMTLLVIAGLLVNGFARLLAVDPGFDHERIAMANLRLSPIRYPDGAARAEFLERLETTLEAHPAVQGVTVSAGHGFSTGAGLQAEDAPIQDERPILIPHASVAADYFPTMGTRIVEGRPLDASDAGTDHVVVDRDLAGFLWGEQSPLGRRFRVDDGRTWWTVVGVVEELRLMGRDQRSGPHQFLLPRDPRSVGAYVEIAMRTTGPPEALLPVFEETLRGLDPEQWIWKLRSGTDALAAEEDRHRFVVTLMSILALVAVTLAAVGLYGVLAYSVSRRDRELGIRLALGAKRGRVQRMVLGEGLALATLGVALGVGGALFGSRLLERLLYEVEPGDPATTAGAALLFLVVAGAASLLPAVRATRVDPVEVLKAE